MDIAVANAGDLKVTLLWGKGDGTFDPPQDVSAPKGPFSLTAADFDGDGDLDLAVADFGDINDASGAGVTILKNTGPRAFTAQPRREFLRG